MNHFSIKLNNKLYCFVFVNRIFLSSKIVILSPTLQDLLEVVQSKLYVLDKFIIKICNDAADSEISEINLVSSFRSLKIVDFIH